MNLRRDSVRSYHPGDWFGIVGERAVVILPPTEKPRVAALWELVDDEWKPYTGLDGAATYETGGILAQYWGKSFTLSQWYPEYNWVADDGAQRFDRWVG